MLIENIVYPRPATCTGRNGSFQSSGVEIALDDGEVDLQSRTSRDSLGNCHVKFPVESLDDVIAALNRLKAGTNCVKMRRG